MKDWSALEDAADALRRLNRAVAEFDVPDDEWRDLALEAHALAGRLESGRVRVKQDDLVTASNFAAVLAGAAPVVAVGETLEFDPFSAAGGRLHPASVGVDFRRDGEASVVATVRVHPMFQGPPGRVHGGIVALMLDELMGAVNRVTAQRAYTARLTVNLRAAAPIGAELTMRAWLSEVDGRKITIRAEGRSDEGLFAEADGLFITVDPPPA